MSHWVQSMSGHAYDLDNLDPRKIELIDVAHSLSNLCRFTGHCRTFYSVAQHSVIVAKGVRKAGFPSEVVREALLHDAREAIMGDITSPVKRWIAQQQWGPFDPIHELDMRCGEVMSERFGVPIEMTEPVKLHDLRALATEKRDLMLPSSRAWGELPEPYPEKIHPLNPNDACALFLYHCQAWGIE